jgi:hypothetical protein
MVRYTRTLEQRVFLCDSCVKNGSAKKCRRKFHNERAPSRQTIHNLGNKLRTMGILKDKKQKHKRRVLTEKLDDTGARLEHTPRKSLNVYFKTGVSKSSARRATQLLKHRSYKTITIHALQLRDPAGRVNFCSWFL